MCTIKSNIQSTYYTYAFPRRYLECSSCPSLPGPFQVPVLVPLLKWLVAKCCMITAGERRHHHIQGIARKKKKKPQLIHRDVILVIDSCPFYCGCLFS